MSKSEKRFFKMFSAIQSGEKNYLKIFDYIEKQYDYNEEELKEHFKHETFIRHLPSEKNHLYKTILKSMRSYFAEQSVSSILKQEIRNIEILYNKALYKECRKFLKRAKSIAKDYEKFYYWYELIAWERRLVEEAYEFGDFDVDLNKLIDEESLVIDKLRNLAEYQVLYSKINYIFRSGVFSKNNEERAQVDAIANNHLIKGKNTAISTSASSICYYIKGICAATNRNYEDSYTFFNRTKEILDNHPKLRAETGKRYVLTLYHLVKCYLHDRNYTMVQKVLNTISDLSNEKGFDSIDMRVRIFSIHLNETLNLFSMNGEFQQAVAFIEEKELEISEYGDKISKEQILKYLFNSAYAYFGAGDYKMALRKINEILNDNETKLRQDIFGFARLLNLLVHVELENFDFLEYELKSTKRFLSKTERDYLIESFIIKMIRKVSKCTSYTEKLDVFEVLQPELNELLSDHNERVVLEYFDLAAWVYAKRVGVSFSEAVKMTQHATSI